MGRSSAPPVNGKVLRRARLGKFMSQSDVLRELDARGVTLDQGNLSKIERGLIKWPALRVIPALAEVVGLTTDELFAADPQDGGSDEASGGGEAGEDAA
jgi:transcriptional regulator with XRE-family HTH domain